MNKEITPEDIYEVLSELLPKQNDYAKCNYKEEWRELLEFDIRTKEALHALISKHKDAMMEEDADVLDETEIPLLTAEYGKAFMEDKIKNNYWYAYPALLRNALLLEFGDKYEKYADWRDGTA